MRQITRKDIERILESDNFENDLVRDNFENDLVRITQEALNQNYLVLSNPLLNLLNFLGDPTHPKEKIINCSYYWSNCGFSKKCPLKQNDKGCAYQEKKKEIMAKISKMHEYRQD